jgi:hypothetical protein
MQIRAALATADATASYPVDNNDLAGVWPIVSIFDESGANGIIADVIPFLPVGLVASQDVIVESRLPKTAQFLPCYSGWFSATGTKRCIQTSFQSLDPFAQRDLSGDSEADEQVNVIRHNDISSNTDAKVSCSSAIFDDAIVYFRLR